MKKQRNVLIALIVAVSLLAVSVALLAQKKNAEEAAESAAETANDISLFAADDAKTITYNYGQPITLQKNDESDWQLENDSETVLDQTKISSMVTAVCLISPNRVLPENSDVAEYGLSPAAMTVTVTTKDDTEYSVNFGDVNPVTGDVYLMVDGDAAVYTASAQKLATFEVSPADLIKTEETAEDAEQTESANAEADRAAFEAAEAGAQTGETAETAAK